MQNYKITHGNEYEQLFFAKCKKAVRDSCLLLRPHLMNHRYELDYLIVGRIV